MPSGDHVVLDGYQYRAASVADWFSGGGMTSWVPAGSLGSVVVRGDDDNLLFLSAISAARRGPDNARALVYDVVAIGGPHRTDAVRDGEPFGKDSFPASIGVHQPEVSVQGGRSWPRKQSPPATWSALLPDHRADGVGRRCSRRQVKGEGLHARGVTD